MSTSVVVVVVVVLSALVNPEGICPVLLCNSAAAALY